MEGAYDADLVGLSGGAKLQSPSQSIGVAERQVTNTGEGESKDIGS